MRLINACYCNRMSRTYGIGIAAALVLAGVAAWVLYSSANLPWQAKKEPASVLEHTVTPSGDRVHERSSEFFDIRAQYPDKTDLPRGLSDDATLAMETWLRTTVDGFIAEGNFDELTEEDKEIIGFASGRKYALDITYKKFESPRTVSYVYTVYTDTLGAHPNGYFYIFMFDTRTGARLTLGDILEGDWLAYVSAESKAQITAHLREMMGGEGEASLFEEGLLPREGNFLNAYIDTDAIVILFDPYQVAAYAAGPQEVRIPLSKVRGMLRADYR
jgi:hypothetical protein